MRNLSLDQLRSFLDIVELGSFSAAARRRRLSQPAVSQQLRQLEQRFGLRLIERVGRLARPTPAGSELLEHARRIDAAAAAALDAMARHAKGAPGRVRLGTGATACIFLLPPVLRELRRRLPAAEITVSTGNTADILKGVEENLLDLGLVTMPVAGRMFQVMPLLKDELVLIAPRGGAPLPGKITPSVLAELPMLLYEPGGNTRRAVDAWFAQAGIAPKPAMSLGSVEAIKELVRAGLGYSLLPRMAVPQTERGAALSPLSLTPKLHRELALVMRRDKPLHRGLREMIAQLKAVAGRIR